MRRFATLLYIVAVFLLVLAAFAAAGHLGSANDHVLAYLAVACIPLAVFVERV